MVGWTENPVTDSEQREKAARGRSGHRACSELSGAHKGDIDHCLQAHAAQRNLAVLFAARNRERPKHLRTF